MITLVIGALAAVGVALGVPPADRTIATVVTPVQLLMSVTVPFFGVLLAADLRRSHRTRVAPTAPRRARLGRRGGDLRGRW